MVMSKQQRAPGGLELVRAFVNTIDLELGDEQLADPSALRLWLIERGLAEDGVQAHGGDLRRAIRLREALRAILLAHNLGVDPPAEAGTTLNQTAARARLRLTFDEHGRASLEPDATGVDAALGRLLAIVDGAISEGTWERLKACREHSCEWAFYDHTKNRSGAWCTMAVCGNRSKARAYRERRASSATVA